MMLAKKPCSLLSDRASLIATHLLDVVSLRATVHRLILFAHMHNLTMRAVYKAGGHITTCILVSRAEVQSIECLACVPRRLIDSHGSGVWLS